MKFACLLLIVISTTAVSAQPGMGESSLVISTPPFGVQNRWPLYKTTKYLEIEEFEIHVLGTATVSDWFMLESYHLIRNMVAALRSPEDRNKFAGHRAFLITDADPDLRGGRGQRNTGGRGFSLFNEALVCAEAVDTLYPDAKPAFRAWNTPVHEFGHSIERTLRLEARSNDVFSHHVRNYKDKVAREYFAWAVQTWFSSTPGGRGRDSMPVWKYDFLANFFSEESKWVPECSEIRTGFAASRTAATENTGSDFLRTKKDESTDKDLLHGLDLETVAGTYRRNPVENKWHVGEISIEERDAAGRPTIFRWKNRAGRSWRLFPDAKAGDLRTGEENPYYRLNPQNGRIFQIDFDRAKAASSTVPALGFWFQNQLYIKSTKAEQWTP